MKPRLINEWLKRIDFGGSTGTSFLIHSRSGCVTVCLTMEWAPWAPVPKMQLQWGIFCLFFRMFNNKHPNNSSNFFSRWFVQISVSGFSNKKTTSFSMKRWHQDPPSTLQDLALLKDPAFKEHVETYAKDQERRLGRSGKKEKSATFGGQNWGNRDFLMILLDSFSLSFSMNLSEPSIFLNPSWSHIKLSCDLLRLVAFVIFWVGFNHQSYGDIADQ